MESISDMIGKSEVSVKNILFKNNITLPAMHLYQVGSQSFKGMADCKKVSVKRNRIQRVLKEVVQDLNMALKEALVLTELNNLALGSMLCRYLSSHRRKTSIKEIYIRSHQCGPYPYCGSIYWRNDAILPLIPKCINWESCRQKWKVPCMVQHKHLKNLSIWHGMTTARVLGLELFGIDPSPCKASVTLKTIPCSLLKKKLELLDMRFGKEKQIGSFIYPTQDQGVIALFKNPKLHRRTKRTFSHLAKQSKMGEDWWN